MKTLKKLLVLCLVLVICFSLSGCKFIDKIKESKINIVTDDVLEYKGKKYKELPYCEHLWFEVWHSNSEEYYIVEDNIPLLLTGIFGDLAYFYDYKRILIKYDIKGNGTYYAREDIYDDIVNKIESENYFDGYCFSYEGYDKDGFYYKKYQMINDTVSNALEEIIAMGNTEDIDIDLLYTYYMTTIYKCSDDLYFKTEFIELYQTSEHIYLVTYEGEYPDVYAVPEEYVGIITSLADEYIEKTA